VDEKITAVSQPAEKMRYLSELAVFQDLSPREMEELNRITTMSTVQKGRVFYRPEEPGEVLFILKEGKVQLYRISPEGKKLVITTLGSHTLFGEMALLGAKMHNTFAEAVEDCLICVMSRNDLERLILSKPQVALRILEITGRRLRDAEERLENMAFKGIPARLASMLLRLAEEQGSSGDQDRVRAQVIAERQLLAEVKEEALKLLKQMDTRARVRGGGANS